MFVSSKRKKSTPDRLFRARSSSSNRSWSPRNPISVILRVRPPSAKEQAFHYYRDVVDILDDTSVIFDPEDENIFYQNGKLQMYRDITKCIHKNMQFDFDNVFDPESTTTEVYDTSIKGLITSLIKGYNCSVFAYGATGSGKTYTMLGNPKNPGIATQLMQDLYLTLEHLEDFDFKVMVSYLEIYNEMVQDLLVDTKKILQLRESGIDVMVDNLSWHCPASANDLMALLHGGNARRTQHPTEANAESSRSHAVFQVRLTMKRRSGASSRNSYLLHSKLSMIDLAGSERASSTKNNAERFFEGANINKSLLSLGNCINALASGLKHVPFRDSKLTRLLKGSLGGNCRTVMIANVSPSVSVYEDTYNTLKYATRAKKIKSMVRKNEQTVFRAAADYVKIIEEKNSEVTALKAKLSSLQTAYTELKFKYMPQSTSPISKRPASLTLKKDETIPEKISLICELREKLSGLVIAKEALCNTVEKETKAKLHIEKLNLYVQQKKFKLAVAKSFHLDAAEYERMQVKIEEYNAAQKFVMNEQLIRCKEEFHSNLHNVHIAQVQLKALAESYGPEAIEMLQILRRLMKYTALPNFVNCNVTRNHLKEILAIRTKDVEQLQTAFCSLAQECYYLLQNSTVCSLEIKQKIERLGMLISQQCCQLEEKEPNTAMGDFSISSCDTSP